MTPSEPERATGARVVVASGNTNNTKRKRIIQIVWRVSLFICFKRLVGISRLAQPSHIAVTKKELYFFQIEGQTHFITCLVYIKYLQQNGLWFSMKGFVDSKFSPVLQAGLDSCSSLSSLIVSPLATLGWFPRPAHGSDVCVLHRQPANKKRNVVGWNRSHLLVLTYMGVFD